MTTKQQTRSGMMAGMGMAALGIVLYIMAIYGLAVSVSKGIVILGAIVFLTSYAFYRRRRANE